MKKRLLRFIKNESSLTFAIKRESLNSGELKLTPVVKIKGLFGQWVSIVKVNDRYEAIDLHNTFKYTEKDCIQFIEGYREQIAKEKGHLINSVTFQEIY
jgi:hypothetical protein